MRLSIWLSVLLIILAILLALYLYPTLPEKIPSHWNAAGEIDGYMDKGMALLFIPALMTGIVVLMVLLPRIDPKKRNYASFQGAYDGFIVLLTIFLFCLFLITLLAATGMDVPMNAVMSILFSVVFGGVGILLGKVEPNWFVGIKTPWTLEDEEVWRATHRLGARVFLLCGVLCLGGVVLPDFAYIFILVPVIIGTCGLIVYSYLLYRRRHPV